MNKCINCNKFLACERASEGIVEIKYRATGETAEVSVEEAIVAVKNLG